MPSRVRMMTAHHKILLTISLVFAGLACGRQDAAPPTDPLPAISVEALSERLVSGRETFILDVRTPEEYDGPLGHIAGARLIPVQAVADQMGELSDLRDKEIFVICRSGNRSATATRILMDEGFEAINVLGGMQAWNQLPGQN